MAVSGVTSDTGRLETGRDVPSPQQRASCSPVRAGRIGQLVLCNVGGSDAGGVDLGWRP